eukprot:gene22802-5737_t
MDDDGDDDDGDDDVSGWSCLDKFNSTQGDPASILAAASQIASRFGLPSLGLHWYEWQCGTKSKDGYRFKFDTQYPDYFPARRAKLMKEVVAELRIKHNIFT